MVCGEIKLLAIAVKIDVVVLTVYFYGVPQLIAEALVIINNEEKSK